MRFPEFSGGWQSCQIGDYGEVITGNTPPTNDYINYANGTHLWASPVDLGKTKFVIDTQTKLSSIGFNKTRKLPEGSILVTCIGSTIGKMGMAATEMSTNQQINSIVVNAQNDKHFVYYALQSRFPRYLTSVSVQAVPIMSKSSFEKQQNYRTTLEEQKKIGILLNLIDERISTQNRIINELQSLIIGLEQTLLKSQSNWTSCFIGDVLSIGCGRDYKHLSEGDIPVYGTGGYMLSVNDFLYDGESVCIGRKGTIDKPLYLHCKFWTVDTLFYTYDFRQILPRYCYYLFNTINWLKYNEASGVPSLSKDTIERIKISIPSIEEQKRVCDIIDSVDEKLSLEITFRGKLISLKQFLLSSLFV